MPNKYRIMYINSAFSSLRNWGHINNQLCEINNIKATKFFWAFSVLFLKPLFPIATTGRHFFVFANNWQMTRWLCLNFVKCLKFHVMPAKKKKKTRPLCLPPHLTGNIKSFSQYTLCHEKTPSNLFYCKKTCRQTILFLRKNV